MTPAQQMESYFRSATGTSDTIGMEIETQFVTAAGTPVTLEESQKMLRDLAALPCWSIGQTKANGTFIVMAARYGSSR